MTVEITTLANGMRIVSEEMPHLESASVGVWVDAGARYETPEVNGVAHLLEHMAFKGTKRRNAREIAEAIEAVGGNLNAYTSREQTAYFARVLKGDVPLAIDILADILQHSVFEPDELAREREVVIQEIGQTDDTPDDVVFDHLQAVCYPEQPLGRSILGTVDKVRAMQRETLFAFKARHYHAPRMILAAAGAVRHRDLVRLAEEAFSELPAAADSGWERASYGGGDYREARDLEQVHFTLALPGLDYADDDFYAIQVMSTVLGGGMSSRLFQEVREKRGLCYSVFSFSASYVDGGTFGLYAGTGDGQVAELVPVMCEELLRLAEDASEEETARARAQLKAGLLMSMESSSSRSEQLARQMLIYGRPLPVPEIVERVEQVDAGAVRRVARRVSEAGRPSIAAIGPIRNLASYDSIAANFR